MTNRRAIQVAKRVEKWQTLLGPLGLAHYRIDRVTCVDSDPGPGGNRGALASVRPSTNYDVATFEFSNEFVDEAYDSGDFRELDTTILHEWVHVLFQKLNNVIWLIEDHLAPAVKDMWEATLDHETETLVDRIAQQLYEDLKDYI